MGKTATGPHHFFFPSSSPVNHTPTLCYTETLLGETRCLLPSETLSPRTTSSLPPFLFLLLLLLQVLAKLLICEVFRNLPNPGLVVDGRSCVVFVSLKFQVGEERKRGENQSWSREKQQRVKRGDRTGRLQCQQDTGAPAAKRVNFITIGALRSAWGQP